MTPNRRVPPLDTGLFYDDLISSGSEVEELMAQGLTIENDPQTIQEKFERFHKHHPDVYVELVSLARRWRERGRDIWAIDAAFEVFRWERRMVTPMEPYELFKLNNNYRSRYARLIMDQEKDLSDVFMIRELQTD